MNELYEPHSYAKCERYLKEVIAREPHLTSAVIKHMAIQDTYIRKLERELNKYRKGLRGAGKERK